MDFGWKWISRINMWIFLWPKSVVRSPRQFWKKEKKEKRIENLRTISEHTSSIPIFIQEIHLTHILSKLGPGSFFWNPSLGEKFLILRNFLKTFLAYIHFVWDKKTKGRVRIGRTFQHFFRSVICHFPPSFFTHYLFCALPNISQFKTVKFRFLTSQN